MECCAHAAFLHKTRFYPVPRGDTRVDGSMVRHEGRIATIQDVLLRVGDPTHRCLGGLAK
ncbi:MAG: hypothetical protein OEV01_15600 [Nitrospira sp.]|nr:hypothetical protein [Nitrospira sp.]